MDTAEKRAFVSRTQEELAAALSFKAAELQKLAIVSKIGSLQALIVPDDVLDTLVEQTTKLRANLAEMRVRDVLAQAGCSRVEPTPWELP